jgi:hypothetical protein
MTQFMYSNSGDTIAKQCFIRCFHSVSRDYTGFTRLVTQPHNTPVVYTTRSSGYIMGGDPNDFIHGSYICAQFFYQYICAIPVARFVIGSCRKRNGSIHFIYYTVVGVRYALVYSPFKFNVNLVIIDDSNLVVSLLRECR